MSDKTAIEWTDATWNPVDGCTPVSTGCSRVMTSTRGQMLLKALNDVKKMVTFFADREKCGCEEIPFGLCDCKTNDHDHLDTDNCHNCSYMCDLHEMIESINESADCHKRAIKNGKKGEEELVAGLRLVVSRARDYGNAGYGGGSCPMNDGSNCWDGENNDYYSPAVGCDSPKAAEECEVFLIISKAVSGLNP